MKRFLIKNIDELHSFACDFLRDILGDKKRETAVVIQLSGDLGAGKTAFVKEVAKCFGIEEEITSPTFVIQKEYNIKRDDVPFKKMIHIDAYRLEDKSELEYLGWNELIQNPEHIIFMEWPEQVEGISLPETILVNIKILDGELREIRVM